MLTAIHSDDLGNLGVDSARRRDRRPSLNYISIFVNKEFLKIPLGWGQYKSYYSNFLKRTLIRVSPSSPDFSFLSHLNTSLLVQFPYFHILPSKATTARCNNLGKSETHQKPTVEDVSDDEDMDFEEDDLLSISGCRI